MKRYSLPLLVSVTTMIAAGIFSASHSYSTHPSKKAPQTPATRIITSRMPSPARKAAKPTGRTGRPQKMASRGNLEEESREMNAVLLTSPKAIWVQKAARRLTLFEDGVATKTYLTTIGRNEFASKTRAGDWATPEGIYRVRRKNPASKYYLALHIDYPNQSDADRGLATGLITPNQYNAISNALARGVMPPQNTRLGYYIEIHGGSNRVKTGPDGQPMLTGWTRGCVGMRNTDIEEMYAWAPMGTPVLITP